MKRCLDLFGVSQGRGCLLLSKGFERCDMLLVSCSCCVRRWIFMEFNDFFMFLIVFQCGHQFFMCFLDILVSDVGWVRMKPKNAFSATFT